MLVHPNFDPVAFAVPAFDVLGLHVHLQVRWYGITYLVGFIGFYWLSRIRGQYPHLRFWTAERVSDVLFYGVLGVILGGRIGYTFFYNYDDHGNLIFFHDPAVIFRIWEGGMSFHGGLIGVLTAMGVYAWQNRLSFWTVTDFIAVGVPFALFTGRLGNFINGELWGAPTSLPWGMVFQNAPDQLPRHPSMLYEAGLEGLALLAILFVFGMTPRPRMAISGLFLLGYGSFRVLVETVREPDRQLGYLLGTTWFTMGMLLCIPMLIAGVTLLVMAYRRRIFEDSLQPVR